MSGLVKEVADEAADIELSAPDVLADAFLTYERYNVTLIHPDGSRDALLRDVVRIGGVVGILCIDPALEQVVLIRQFRLAAHLATGLGQMIEIPAGRLDHDEDWETAARRECLEETGLAPSRMDFMFEVVATPGVIDERTQLFLAVVDAAALPAQAGLASESEVTLPFALPIEDALRLLDNGRCYNGYLRMALQWLALNRARIAALA